MKSMSDSGLMLPYFSLAILRDTSGPSGYIGLGGLPPVPFEGNFTSTPILISSVYGYPKDYDFYTIQVESIELETKSLAGAKFIVDSGTSLNYFPNAISKEINAAFSPPATWDDYTGTYKVDCKAKAPSLGVNIGGTMFYINTLDMIIQDDVDDNGNPLCVTGVTDGGDDVNADLFILGDIFLKNVIAVFDFGVNEMLFISREFYSSNDPY